MERFAQVGIALGALGIIVTLMGLFPGITGVEPTVGIGVVQVVMVLSGYAMLIAGAIIYVKYTFYTHSPHTLAQQIGIRLAMTGLLFATLSGLADIVGFGSHIRTDETDIFLGELQQIGLVASFVLSSIGVLIYAITGNPEPVRDEDMSDTINSSQSGESKIMLDNDHQSYTEEMSQKVTALKSEIEVYKSQAEKAEDANKLDYYERIEELQAELAGIERHLRGMHDESEDVLVRIRGQIDRAWQQTQEKFSALKDDITRPSSR